MSATTRHLNACAPPVPQYRFGRESAGADGSVQWLLKRNCSMAPRHVLVFYVSLCVLSLGISGVFWFQGATLILPFAWVELLGVGAALLVYARHAADNERISLQAGRLTVAFASGRRTEAVEFAPEWVRVERLASHRALIELSGQGQRIAVGRFVRPELRRQLADELRWALRCWQTAAAAAPRCAP